jgi:hypothetical protein
VVVEGAKQYFFQKEKKQKLVINTESVLIDPKVTGSINLQWLLIPMHKKLVFVCQKHY